MLRMTFGKRGPGKVGRWLIKIVWMRVFTGKIDLILEFCWLVLVKS